MRIGCLQFAPQVGDIDNNLNRADAVLSKANFDDLDLLVLPELAFSGCNFKSLQDIAPFLEPSGSGIAALWARTVALRYNCKVAVGYPEKVDVSTKWPTGPEYYNSLIIVNGDGETIVNYRKSFLYRPEESWALEGNRGFFDGYIPELGNTSIGIGMDLNPYRFEAPWHAFEFAFHVLQAESNLVVVSMAWMTPEEPRNFSRMPNEPDIDTLTYWVTRLEPIIRTDNQDEIIVVFCNRTGTEGNVTYAGTSAVIGIQDGEVNVYGLLGRGEKGLLVVDTESLPYAKLVHHQETNAASKKSQGQGGNADKNVNNTNPLSERVSRTPHLPLMPPTDSVEPSNMVTSKRPQVSNITIPKAPGLVENTSASEADGFNIPTPSHPSPTPMALRPRLMIPESPPVHPYHSQYSAQAPISALSERSTSSMSSILSFKSEESEASVQTIRSNPRPPEDSTPYPYSGAPLSGYPSRTFDPEKRIYGGDTMTSIPGDDYSSAGIPTNDISPMSSRLFWRPPESLLRTPISTIGSVIDTPLGRKGESSPWSALKSSPHPQSRTPEQDFSSNKSTSHEPQVIRSHSPQSNPSTNETKGSGRSISATRSPHKEPGNLERERVPDRPSSPKSRNASRSRVHERSSSALSKHESAPAISQYLQNIARLTGSASGDSVPGRPQSPKSRNCSRGRTDQHAEPSPDHHTIPIAASPSVFSGQNIANPFRSPSRTLHQLRSNSVSLVNDGHQLHKSQGSNTPNVDSDQLQANSRAVSRGRLPDPKLLPTNGVSDMVVGSHMEIMFTKNGKRLESQTRHARSETRLPSAPCSGAGHQLSGEPEPIQFERVEAIICPSCPVHGQHSSSKSTQLDEIPSQLAAFSGADDPQGESSSARRDHPKEGTAVPSQMQQQQVLQVIDKQKAIPLKRSKSI